MCFQLLQNGFGKRIEERRFRQRGAHLLNATKKSVWICSNKYKYDLSWLAFHSVAWCYLHRKSYSIRIENVIPRAVFTNTSHIHVKQLETTLTTLTSKLTTCIVHVQAAACSLAQAIYLNIPLLKVGSRLRKIKFEFEQEPFRFACKVEFVQCVFIKSSFSSSASEMLLFFKKKKNQNIHFMSKIDNFVLGSDFI